MKVPPLSEPRFGWSAGQVEPAPLGCDYHRGMRPKRESQSDAPLSTADRFINDASLDTRFCSIGAHCEGRPIVHVYQGDRNRVLVGENVVFGADVSIFVGGNHRTDWVTTFGLREVLGLDGAFEGNPWSKGDVVVSDQARIGRGAKIMSGVTVGARAVVRPFSVVVSDIEGGSIVEGCPARSIGRVDIGAVTDSVERAFPGTEPLSATTSLVATLRCSVIAMLRRLSRVLRTHAAIEPTGPIAYSNLTMGHATYFAPIVHGGVEAGKVTIGSYSSIPYDGEMALDTNEPFAGDAMGQIGLTVAPSDAAPFQSRRTRDIAVGNDVWIGRGGKVLGGVTIGDGAVVAAYSVVTSDVRPYAIVAGNPAHEVGRRFDDETIEALLQIKWWTWPPAVVRSRASELCSADVQAFVNRYSSHGARAPSDGPRHGFRD